MFEATHFYSATMLIYELFKTIHLFVKGLVPHGHK